MLSDKGKFFAKEPTRQKLADFIQERFRLFGEMLDIISEVPVTIEEADKKNM